MKWVPALLWPVLQPRARGWGLMFLAAVGAAVAGDAAADDRPAPGAVRVRRRGRSAPTTSCSSGRPCRGGGGIGDPFAFLRPRSWREAAAFQLARARALGRRRSATRPRRARATRPGQGSASRSGAPSGSRTAGGATGSPRPRPTPVPARSPPTGGRRSRSGRRCRTWRRQICWRPPGGSTTGRSVIAAERVQDHAPARTRPAGRGLDAAARVTASSTMPPSAIASGVAAPVATLRQAHVPARRGPRDDVGHQRPVDREEHPARRPEQRRADERHRDRRRERGDGDPDRRRSRTTPRSAACARSGRTAATAGKIATHVVAITITTRMTTYVSFASLLRHPERARQVDHDEVGEQRARRSGTAAARRAARRTTAPGGCRSPRPRARSAPTTGPRAASAAAPCRPAATTLSIVTSSTIATASRLSAHLRRSDRQRHEQDTR